MPFVPAARPALWGSFVILLLTAAPAAAQSTYTWNPTTTNNAWLTTANWTGGPSNTFPGTTSGLVPDGTAFDTAVIGNFAFNPANGLGINFTDGTGAQGVLGIGAIQLAPGGGGNLRIGNSSGTRNGEIYLNGAIINGIANVLLANTSGGRTLTIANTPNGIGSQTMRLNLPTTDGVTPTFGVFLVNAGGTIVISSSILETTTFSGFSVRGGGTVELTAANFHQGAVTVTESSTLRVSQDTSLGNAPQVNSPGRLTLNNGTLAATASFSLHNLRGVALGPTSGSGSGTIDVASNQTLSYGGTIANNTGGTGSLVKTGAGTLTLTGMNTYTGTTTVNAGTLTVGTGGSITTAPAAVTVNATGRLSGVGTVNRPVTINGGGALAPGNGLNGTLTVAGQTVLNSGAKLTATLAAPGANGSGRVAVQGGSTTFDFRFGSFLELSPTGGFGMPGTYTLVSMPSGGGTRILLNGAPTTNGQVLGTYVQGTGQSGDVTIIPLGFALPTGSTFTLTRSGDAAVLTYFVPVPEPATILGIAAAGLGLGAAVRRRRRAVSGCGPVTE